MYFYCLPLFLLFISIYTEVSSAARFSSIFPIWGMCLTFSLNLCKSTNLSLPLADELTSTFSACSPFPLVVYGSESNIFWLPVFQYHFSSFVSSLFFFSAWILQDFSLSLFYLLKNFLGLSFTFSSLFHHLLHFPEFLLITQLKSCQAKNFPILNYFVT